jgi:hypothetical protein
VRSTRALLPSLDAIAGDHVFLSQIAIAIPPAPTPTITSFVPPNIVHGGPELTLTVKGTGVTPDTIVQWNGTDHATIFLSPTKLFVRVPAADIATAGTATVLACTTGSCSAPASFTIN